MWISKGDLKELGLSDATIWRRMKSGEFRSQTGKRVGRNGGPPVEIELESLPFELQLRWKQLNEKRASAVVSATPSLSEAASSADEDLMEHVGREQTSTDERLQRYAAALARFSVPEYTPAQREAVERRCLEMAGICDDVLEFSRKGRKGRRDRTITVHSPGSTEAGPNRAYHPALKSLAKRAACADPIYVAMYPSSSKPPSVFTLLNLAKTYRRNGLAAFIRERQTLSPDRDKRFKPQPEAAIAWLRTYGLKSYAHGAVTLFGKRWLEANERHKWGLKFTEHRPGYANSCYSFLYKWVNRVPAAAMALAQKGELGFEAGYAPYIRRHKEDLLPREVWNSDWRQFDIAWWVPALKEGYKPALVRRWLCPMHDIASDAVFGFAIDDRPSAMGITRAYIDAVGDSPWKSEPGFEILRGMQRTNDPDKPPKMIWDNGKDFRSQTVEGREIPIAAFDMETGLKAILGTYAVGLAKDFGFDVQHAKVRNAKAKPIERWFGNVSRGFDAGEPGYCGNNPQAKPHWYPAALRIHKCFTERQPGRAKDIRQLPPLWLETYEETAARFEGAGTPFLEESVGIQRFIKWLLNHLQEPCKKLADEIGVRSRIEYLNTYAGAPHKMSEDALSALAMPMRVETVHRGEIVMQWGGERFVFREVASTLSQGDAIHSIPDRTEVEVRYKPDLIGRALVMTSGGMLCWVENSELLGYRASEGQLGRAMAEKKKAKKTADDYFADKTDRTDKADWRNEAEAQRNVIAMPKAVNYDGPIGEVGDEDPGPWGPETPKKTPVTVISRFDRSSNGGRGKAFGGLSMVPTIFETDDDDLFDTAGEAIENLRDDPDDDGFSDLL